MQELFGVLSGSLASDTLVFTNALKVSLELHERRPILSCQRFVVKRDIFLLNFLEYNKTSNVNARSG